MLAYLAEVIWDTQTLSVLGAFAVPITGILAWAWYSAHKVRSENNLKRAMVDRGMTAAEIERVIAAKSEQDSGA